MSDTCHYCGTSEEELRPYGPGGAQHAIQQTKEAS